MAESFDGVPRLDHKAQNFPHWRAMLWDRAIMLLADRILSGEERCPPKGIPRIEPNPPNLRQQPCANGMWEVFREMNESARMEYADKAHNS